MGRGRRSFRAAFSHRDFRFLFAAFAISSAGDWIYGVALLAFVFDATGSPSWVAAASMIRLLPHAVLGPLGGVIADRFERRSVLLVCDVVRAIGMFGIAAVARFDGPVVSAMVLVFLTTAAGTPYSPAFAAMNPALVGERDLTAANAVTSVVEHAAIIIGPAVGGVLLLLGSPAAAFAVNGATFAVSASLIGFVRTRSKVRADRASFGFRRRLIEGVSAITGSREITALVGLIVGAALVYGQEFVVLVLVSKDLLGTGAGGVSFLMLAVGFGGLAGAFVANRLGADARPRRTLVVAALFFGAPLAMLGFLSEPWPAYLAMAISGGATIVLEVVGITLLQRSLSRDVLARVFGILESLAVAAILLGSLIAPVLIAMGGLRVTLVIAGALLPTLALVTAPSLKTLNKRAIERMLELRPRVSLLSRLGVFEGASRQALESIALSLQEESVAEGDTVVAEGDRADDFYVVRTGRLDVYSRGEGDLAKHVNSLREGDYFGEIGLLERIPRTATVVAASPCTLYRIRGEDFINTMNQSPSLSGTLLDGVVGRLAQTHPSYGPRVAGERST